MIKAFFQKWFLARVVKPITEPSVITTLRETNAALDGLIASQNRLIEVAAVAKRLEEMSDFLQTAAFRSMAKNDKKQFDAFWLEFDDLLSKMVNA